MYIGDLPISDLLGGCAIKVASKETEDSFRSYLENFPQMWHVPSVFVFSCSCAFVFLYLVIQFCKLFVFVRLFAIVSLVSSGSFIWFVSNFFDDVIIV